MGKESNTPFTYLVTFKEEYSLDQKRSCSSWKIRIEKFCLFFEFVWFSECHFTYSLNLQTRTLEIFFKILNFYLTFVHPISKVWRLIKFPIMISWPNIMQIVKLLFQISICTAEDCFYVWNMLKNSITNFSKK